MTKGLTTNYLLTKTYNLKAGETILFHAAAGGVGQIFAQWANSIGAKVIGTVGTDEKIAIAKENGYNHVINYSKDDFAKEVLPERKDHINPHKEEEEKIFAEVKEKCSKGLTDAFTTTDKKERGKNLGKEIMIESIEFIKKEMEGRKIELSAQKLSLIHI